VRLTNLVPLSLRSLWGIGLLALALPAGAEPLRVVATTPDLADLVVAVGGDAVEAQSLARGPQDPHFLEPRPSFVRALHRADALVVVGLDLEAGWLPTLLRGARNPEIVSGGRGYVDASLAIEPRGAVTAPADRSMGDVHPRGNPHYLTDPRNGLAVAKQLAERLSELRPEAAPRFAARLAAFESRVEEKLAAWRALARASTVRSALQDHLYWGYFAACFGLELVGTLEPKPGIPPTTLHLSRLIERTRARPVDVVLANPYYDPRHARFVAEQTGARVAEMAHQAGARPGADGYLGAIDHNVRAVFGSP